MKTQRQGIKDILIPLFVVIPHIVEQCFFVANVAIMREMVVEDELAGFLYLFYVFQFEKGSPMLVGLLVDCRFVLFVFLVMD